MHSPKTSIKQFKEAVSKIWPINPDTYDLGVLRPAYGVKRADNLLRDDDVLGSNRHLFLYPKEKGIIRIKELSGKLHLVALDLATATVKDIKEALKVQGLQDVDKYDLLFAGKRFADNVPVDWYYARDDETFYLIPNRALVKEPLMPADRALVARVNPQGLNITDRLVELDNWVQVDTDSSDTDAADESLMFQEHIDTLQEKIDTKRHQLADSVLRERLDMRAPDRVWLRVGQYTQMADANPTDSIKQVKENISNASCDGDICVDVNAFDLGVFRILPGGVSDYGELLRDEDIIGSNTFLYVAPRVNHQGLSFTDRPVELDDTTSDASDDTTDYEINYEDVD